MGWTTAEVSKYVKARLGYPKRNVELAKCSIEEFLQRAIRQVSTWRPILRHGSFIIAEGIQGYNFTTLGKEFGKGLTDVYDEPITNPSAVFSEFEYYRLRQPPYVDMGELLMDQMYYKEIGHLTGTNFDWQWDQPTTTLLITPKPTRTRGGAYVYNAEVSKIDELPGVDQGWVAEYTLALAKEALGRIRGKFQGVPGNDLPVETDWAELLSEGLEAQERLLEGLKEKGKGAWVPPIKG